MRDQFRGVLEWRTEGNPLTTASNEACRMYDAALTQYVGWYNDKNLGGLKETLDKMFTADPNFVMGRCLSVGLDMISMGTSMHTNDSVQMNMDALNQLVKKAGCLNEREFKHVNAINCWAQGDLKQAVSIWEQILIENPTDMHAVKMAFDTYFFLGQKDELRDSIARVLPFWQSSQIPLKNYLHGMYAFGLEETNFYDMAVSEAKFGLSRNPKDGWATHSLGHVYEMKGLTADGIKLYESTQDDWSYCDMLSCHNYWHLALYYIEIGDYDRAFELYNTKILAKTMETKGMLELIDSSAFLYRLDLIEENKRDRSMWNAPSELIKPYLSNHLFGFNDAHFMMSLLGSKRYEEAEELVKTLKDDHPTYNVTKPLLEAMIAYDRQKFDQTVDLLVPVRYQLYNLGGSNAQRDIFNQLLIMAAIKSPVDNHRKLAEHLIVERNQFKDVSPLNNVLIQRLNRN